jgi:hypothetical protein
MKNIYSILAAVLLTFGAYAQAPQKMSYQSVIRNGNNALVTSTAIGMRISILQGSGTGSEVYKEIYNPNPQTNANGLVTLQIGSGIPVTGTFASINWANGPYFIKTETDPTGGTNYSITGTSELLSVPFALYAKTAETISGTIVESDPVFGASPAKGITNSQIGNWNTAFSWGNHASAGYLTGNTAITGATKTKLSYDSKGLVTAGTDATTADIAASANRNYVTDAQLVVIGNTSGINTGDYTHPSGDGNLHVPATGTSNSGEVLTAGATAGSLSWQTPSGGSASHYAGELYQGGVVYWVDPSGNHGLICSMIDLSTLKTWSDLPTTLVGVSAQSDWDGQTNTNAIVAQSISTSAADFCDLYTNVDYGTGVYSDWYLPSTGELNDLWNNMKSVQKALDSDGNSTTKTLAKNVYWSSTESASNTAWCYHFTAGYADDVGKNNTFYVRAVRAF